ncbi:MAG: NB-ARC domain-containing protein, partial [Cyanobacteria bacterium P01_D01_bin.56]
MAESQENDPKGSCQLPKENKELFKRAWKKTFGTSPGYKDGVAKIIEQQEIETSVPTVIRFYKGERVEAANAKIICDACGLDWREVTVYNTDNTTTTEDTVTEESLNITKNSAEKKVPHNLQNSGAFSFVGRESDIASLHNLLQDQDDLRPVVISAIGGSGKTELALQYAKAYLQEYPCGVCWIDNGQKSISPANIIINFAITYLNISPPERLKTQAMRLEYCLFHWPQQEKTLLIFDDVAEYAAIETCIPQHNHSFRVLITTRKVLGVSFKQYSLNCLSDDSAIKLIANITGNNDYLDSQYQDASKLCEWLGGLPLAIELVARCIYRSPSVSLGQILTTLKEQTFSTTYLKHEEGMTAKRGLSATFALIWQELAYNDTAQRITLILGLFPVKFIHSGFAFPYFPKSKKQEVESIIEDFFIKNGLIKEMKLSFNAKTDSQTQPFYEMHNLTRLFFREQLDNSPYSNALKTLYCSYNTAGIITAAQFLKLNKAKIYSVCAKDTGIAWQDFVLAFEHIRVIITDFNDYFPDQGYCFLYDNLFQLLSQLNYRDEALWFAQKGWELGSKKLKKNDIQRAALATSLANAYQSVGNSEEAEKYYTLSEKIAHKNSLIGKIRGSFSQVEILRFCFKVYQLKKQIGLEPQKVKPNAALKLIGYKNFVDGLRTAKAWSKLCSGEQQIMNLKYKEAAQAIQISLDNLERLHPDGHPYVIRAIQALATLNTLSGRQEKASYFYEKALKETSKLADKSYENIIEI